MFSAGQMRPCREAYYQPSDSLKNKNCICRASTWHQITMHLIKLRSFPFMLQHLHHLFNQHQALVASVQNVPFSLKLVDNEALVPVTWNATVCGDVNKTRHFGCSSFPEWLQNFCDGTWRPGCFARCYIADGLCVQLISVFDMGFLRLVLQIPRKFNRRFS